MVEVLYRIYEVADKPVMEQTYGIGSLSKSFSYEVVMDCIVCDDREQFKQIIKDSYGKNIKFAYSRKYPAGTLYCIIIGEHCYDTERYFYRREFDCPCCKNKVTGYIPHPISLNDWEIKHKLCGQYQKYQSLHFCSEQCKEKFLENESKNLLGDDDVLNSWITKDSFDNSKQSGYVYMITKKSTGEFYVGQTEYVPVFRWGQHLKTSRFPIKDIKDYKFEILEVVTLTDNILEREKYWIQLMYKNNPKLSLNIQNAK